MILRATPLRNLFLDDRKPDQVAAGIQRWQEDLNAALGGHIESPLAWNEEAEDCCSQELPESAHRALLLLACYAELTNLEWPDTLSPVVDTDPAWQQAREGDFARFKLPQVVIPRCWVPGDFACTLKFTLPDGEDMVIGSLDGLRLQLRRLNQNTLNLPKDGVDSRLLEAPADEADFLVNAGFGLAAMLFVTGQASRLHVPVLLKG